MYKEIRSRALLNKIRSLNKALYKHRKELNEIQENCKHYFPDFTKKKETRKVFSVVCSKCGYVKTVSEYAAII